MRAADVAAMLRSTVLSNPLAGALYLDRAQRGAWRLALEDMLRGGRAGDRRTLQLVTGEPEAFKRWISGDDAKVRIFVVEIQPFAMPGLGPGAAWLAVVESSSNLCLMVADHRGAIVWSLV